MSRYQLDIASRSSQPMTFSTGVAFDARGTPHVVEEGYSYGEVFTTPRLLRIEGPGKVVEVARGEKNGPWTGAYRQAECVALLATRSTGFGA